MFFTHEFSGNRVLQAALAAISFAYFIVFYQWIGRETISVNLVQNLTYRCPTYFQNCESLYFLNALPYGYSQTLWYMLLFAVLAGVVYLLIERKWFAASLLLLVPYLWHAANVFVLTDITKGNYEYYLFFFTSVILFLPHKEFFGKLLLVLFYVLSTFAKIHPAWVAGTYFTNLQLGLPLFPNWSIPLWTNLVIFMELVAAWFLLSKNLVLQRLVLFFFICFHLYSGILVEYRYPATVLPMILVMFGPWYRWTPVPMTRRSLIGWGLMVLLITLQLSPKFIPGDEKLTMEANHYGLYMFESNHQCISTATYNYTTHEAEVIDAVRLARNRCDPYRFWFRYNEECEHLPHVESIRWTFDHSINGDDFLRIVDVENACDLEYKPFTHNDWIKTHADNPQPIGKPAKNIYY